jgi:hypothetical protein
VTAERSISSARLPTSPSKDVAAPGSSSSTSVGRPMRSSSARNGSGSSSSTFTIVPVSHVPSAISSAAAIGGTPAV